MTEAQELEALLECEAMSLAAITLLVSRTAERQVQGLLVELQNFHTARKDKLIKLLGGKVTELNLSVPDAVQKMLRNDRLTESIIIEFLVELEDELMAAYQTRQLLFTRSQVKELLAECLTEHAALCKRLYAESQSVTQVISHKRKKPPT